jgi:hypothetical protein
MQAPEIGSLFARAGTDDDEPSGALMPVRACGHVGDAYQRPRQVDRIQVLTDVTAFDRALHECANRFPNVGVGSLEYLLRISYQDIECGGDESLRGTSGQTLLPHSAHDSADSRQAIWNTVHMCVRRAEAYRL